jgi:hypothetical protein
MLAEVEEATLQGMLSSYLKLGLLEESDETMTVDTNTLRTMSLLAAQTVGGLVIRRLSSAAKSD